MGWKCGLRRAVQLGLLGVVSLGQPAGAVPEHDVLPDAGAYTNSASITRNELTMTVDGQAARNVISWESFSVGREAAVQFLGNHDYLNFVRGSSASEIYGTISGGGRIYLVNPHGVIFGKSAKINIGSLIVAAKDISGQLGSFESAMGALGLTAAGEVVNKGTLVSAMKVSMKDGVLTFENPGTGVKAAADLDAGAESISFVGTVEDIGASGRFVLCNDIEIPVTQSKATFTGELYGGGHKVRLGIENGSGLFEKIENGRVQDLILTGSVCSAVNQAGSLAGIVKKSHIESIVNDATVVGKIRIGGIIGKMVGGRLEKAVNYGDVSGVGSNTGIFIGGIVGHATEVYISNVANHGTVDAGLKQNAGGIVGYFDTGNGPSTLKYAVNTGDVVNASSYAGGIAGYARNAILGDENATSPDIINRGTVSSVNLSDMADKSLRGIIGYDGGARELVIKNAPENRGAIIVNGETIVPAVEEENPPAPGTGEADIPGREIPVKEGVKPAPPPPYTPVAENESPREQKELPLAEERQLEENIHQSSRDEELTDGADNGQNAEAKVIDLSHSTRPVHVSEEKIASMIS